MLGAGDIHLWQVDLADERWDSGQVVLHPQERHGMDIERRRARTALRLILGHYLEYAPQHLMLIRDELGKPHLADKPLHFSLAHSNSCALIGLSRVSLGVDLEREDESLNCSRLFDWVCHARERFSLEALPLALHRAFYYRLWVAKEAYCKAIGLGLRKPMTSFWLRHFGRGRYDIVDPGEQGGYRLRYLPSLPGWTAACCSRLVAPRLNCYWATPSAQNNVLKLSA